MALIAEYDTKVPAKQLSDDLTAAAEGDLEASRRAMALVDLDERLRAGIADRFGFSRAEQPLLLGREALLVAHSHGLKPGLDEGGEPCLVSFREPGDGEDATSSE